MKIFITGVSSGIGRELTKKLVGQGHEVWGIARRIELLEKLKQEVGGKLKVSECDLLDKSDMAATVKKLRDENFIPDIIILNAGDHIEDTKAGLDLYAFEKTFDLNVTGAMFWVSEFLPNFFTRKSGSIIAISSTSAYRPGLKSVAYPASKAALSMAFRGLRLKYPNKGINFNTVHFGPIRTRLWAGSKSFLNRPAGEAADFIISVFQKKSGTFFFPFLSTFLFRLSLLLPDRLFTFSTGFLKKDQD